MTTWTVTYPETITSKVSLAAAGDTIFVNPGTYLERVILPSNITLIGSSAGEVIVDATGIPGFGASIEIQGVHDVWVHGITCLGGANASWTNVEGIAVRDLGGVGGVGSYNIRISNCTFRNIVPRTGVPTSLGIGILAYSYADERLGHTNGHDIIVEDCYFTDCNPTSTAGIVVGYITFIGNLERVTIKNNHIVHSYDKYGTVANGIETGGNYTPAYPSYPRECLISGNIIESPVPITGICQAIYATVVQDCVIERNIIRNYSFGVMVASEAGDTDLNISERIIIRRNSISCYYAGIALSAWSLFYKPIRQIWCDSNTIDKLLLNDTNGQGRSTELLFTNNIITGEITSDYVGEWDVNNTTDPSIKISNLVLDIPEWVIYNTPEYDLNGYKQKRTKGAEEKQWLMKL